jgi:hypothetical protein
VAQAEKRLEGGRRSPPGTVHRAIAPGTLSPIKTARSKSTPLAKRASEAMGCSKRKTAKKKAKLLTQPSFAGGLAVEVGGKQFIQAGEARRRDAEQIQAGRAERDKVTRNAESEADICTCTEAGCDGRCTGTKHGHVASELPTPHRRPCVNDPAWLRRPTPQAAKTQKEDEDRESASVVEVGPRSHLPRRLGPLTQFADHSLSRTPRLKKLPAPRGRRHQPCSTTALAPPGGIPLDSGDLCGTSQEAAPPVPTIGWAHTDQPVAR